MNKISLKQLIEKGKLTGYWSVLDKDRVYMPVDHESLDFHRIQVGNFHNGAQLCYAGNSKTKRKRVMKHSRLCMGRLVRMTRLCIFIYIYISVI